MKRESELRHSDYRALLEIIDIIHGVPDRMDMFRMASEKLDRLIGLRGAVYMPIDPSFHFPGHILYNYGSAKGPLMFAEHFAPLHPAIYSGKQLTEGVNRFVRITDIVPPSRLRDTEYGCDFQTDAEVDIFYEMCDFMNVQGDWVGCIGLHRKKQDGDFGRREMVIADIVARHVGLAFHRSYLLEAVAPAYETGVIEVADDGTVMFMNEEAMRALNGRPLSSFPIISRGKGDMRIRTGRGDFRARTTKSEGRTMILLEPLPEGGATISRLISQGLTKRQAEVALHAVRGLRNREIAESLFITEQTVKDHLRDVYDKLGVRSRSALAARILGGGLK